MNFVKTPIDLDTIEKKLQREIYASPDDYVADLQLMISNSEVYNTNSHSLVSCKILSKICKFYC